MAKVKHKVTGVVTEVPDSKLGEIAASGEFQVDASAQIPVMVDGKIKTIAPSMVAGLGNRGRLATSAEVDEFRKQREFGEGIGAARGVGESFVRGGTLGMSDLIQTELGVDAEGLRERKERLGVAGTATEVIGAILPTVLSGGLAGGAGVAARAGQAARIIGAPARAAASASRVVETAVASGLGGGRLARVVGSGTGAGLEGAAFGVGQAASEAALTDSALTGEQLLAGAKTGALFGAGAGVLLKGATQLAGAAKDRATRAFRASDDAVGLGGIGGDLAPAGVPVGALDDALPGGPRGVADDARRAVDGEPPIPGVADAGLPPAEFKGFAKEIADDTLGRLKTALDPAQLEDMASGLAFRAGGGGSKATKQAEKFLGKRGVNVVGQDGLDELTRISGKRFESMSVEDLNLASSQGGREWGTRIDEALRGTDNRIAESGRRDLMLDADGLLATLESKMLNELEGAGAGATSVSLAKRIRGEIEPFLTLNRRSREFRDTGKVSFTDLKQRLNTLKSDAIKENQSLGKQGDGMLRAHQVLEKEIEAGIKRVDSAMKTDSGYELAKSKWSSMKVWEDMTADTLTKEKSSGLFSLTDYLGTGIGAGALGASLGGPAGLLLGLASGAVHKFARKRGAAIGAGFLSRFSRTQEMANAAKKVNDASEGAVKRFFDDAPPKTRRGTPHKTAEARQTAYKTEVAEARDLAANPQKVAHRVTQSFGDEAADIAPQTTQSAIATAIRAASFLATKAPTDRTSQSEITAHLDDRQRVSDTEQSKFLRYAEAVKDPMSVVEDFGDGTVSREGAEALRTVYPEMFGRLRTQITDAVIERTEPLPYQQTVRLSLLLDQPMHPLLEARNIAALQAVHGQLREEKKSEGERSVPDLPGSQPTQAQRLSATGSIR